MQLNSLKENLIAGGEGFEEKVEVNQRHLIDKILARYSAEFTVFRELLQNANDAGSSEVEIHFDKVHITNSPPPKKMSFFSSFFKPQQTQQKQCDTVIVKNNGRPFDESDWRRLKSIAEGNPNEDKIGFFGVGFYSLFSLCEEPFVSSSEACMAFFWKGDQLYTKRGAIPKEGQSIWTSFLMDLREPMDIPTIDEFGQFLVTSMGFTVNLQSISVFSNGVLLLQVKKSSVPPRNLDLQATLKSPNKLFELMSLEAVNSQIEVIKFKEIPEKNETSNQKLNEDETVKMFLKVAVGSLSVQVQNKFATDMERVTKKRPPSKTKVYVMYTGFDEFEASTSLRSKNSFFHGLVSFPEQGKIFIGFPTHQTTGCSVHLAAHFIPTVERESIDFVDPTLNAWNQELIAVCGGIVRLVYEDEFSQIQKLSSAMMTPTLNEDSEAKTWLYKKSIHTLKAFTIFSSTPHSLVSKLLKHFFFNSTQRSLPIMTSLGVIPSINARIMDKSMQSFIRNIPYIPFTIVDSCSSFLEQLKSLGILKEITLQDVVEELKSRVLSNHDEIIAFLQWWKNYIKVNNVDDRMKIWLHQNLTMKLTDEEKPRQFHQFTHYINEKVIPPDMPIPNFVLPYFISKAFSQSDLRLFGSMTELTLLDWSLFISQDPKLCDDSFFSEKVLSNIARHIGYQKYYIKEQIIGLFSKKTCIPVSTGQMRIPSECYLKSVKLFEDLPFVKFPKEKSIPEQFLLSLGVKNHVEISAVFGRLDDLNWDQKQLIKYMASVKDDLSADDWHRLKTTAIFLSEEHTTDVKSPQTDSLDMKKSQRFKANDLYQPNQEHRGLGLSILGWNGKWEPNSTEAKFMESLGLQTLIPIDTLITLAATDELKRKQYIHYLIIHAASYTRDYIPSQVQVPFLPSSIFLDGMGKGLLSTPSNCFADHACGVMGFAILDSAFQKNMVELGVNEHPSAEKLVQTLIRNPPKFEQAIPVFSYLASRQSGFSSRDWKTIRSSRFIPIATAVDGKPLHKHTSVAEVYFRTESESQFADFFDYIDFGTVSNMFLKSCGVREEPTPIELAEQIIKQPERFLQTCGVDKYLSILRQMATHIDSIKSNRALLQAMKSAKFLIGFQLNADDVQTQSEGGVINDASPKDEGDYSNDILSVSKYQLARAEDVYIVDDAVMVQIFHPLSAPMETLLESFYSELGSCWISTAVKELVSPVGTPIVSKLSNEVQTLIRYRAPLLLHDFNQQRRLVGTKSQQFLENLEVLEVPRIGIKRMFKSQTHVQKTTACIASSNSGWFEKSQSLLISSDFDYFDVANSLGKVLFKHCKLNDALLLSTLLSSTLPNLRRKGFPVDRILLQSSSRVKAKMASPTTSINTSEELLANSTTRSTESLKSPPPYEEEQKILEKKSIDPIVSSSLPRLEKKILDIIPQANQEVVRQQLQQELVNNKNEESALMAVADRLLQDLNSQRKEGPSKVENRESSTGGIEGGFSKLFNKLSSVSRTLLPALESIGKNDSNQVPGTYPGHRGPRNLIEEPTSSIQGIPRRDVNSRKLLETSLKNLKSNRGIDFESQIHEDPLPPSRPPKLTSCQSPNRNLVFLSEVEGLEFYLDGNVNRETFLNLPLHMASLGAFIDILGRIARIFQISRSKFHIYYDEEGETVAFHKASTLFFNLRFFLGFHFQGSVNNVMSTEQKQAALAYWYIVTCHELAHGFVSDHNASHEFYLQEYATEFMQAYVQESLQL